MAVGSQAYTMKKFRKKGHDSVNYAIATGMKLCFQVAVDMLHNFLFLMIIGNICLMLNIPLGTKLLK